MQTFPEQALTIYQFQSVLVIHWDYVLRNPNRYHIIYPLGSMGLEGEVRNASSRKLQDGQCG